MADAGAGTTVRVRLMSPLGRYPDRSLDIDGRRLLIAEDLVAAVMPSAGVPAARPDRASDLDFLTAEDVRFLAAVVLSLRPEHGMFVLYPLPVVGTLHVDAPADGPLMAQVRRYARTLDPAGHSCRGAALPTAAGGPPYAWTPRAVDGPAVIEIFRGISGADPLMVRGLGALLRADMLWQHVQFRDAAVQVLFVALEASFHLVLRALRDEGMKRPTGLDAAAYIDRIFDPGTASGAYFAEHYANRVRTLHPASRFGVFAYPPLEGDDFYDLRQDLVRVYVHLVLSADRPAGP